GPQLERHPLDRDVLPPHGLLQRKLRQVAERSDVIGIHLDLQAHGPRPPGPDAIPPLLSCNRRTAAPSVCQRRSPEAATRLAEGLLGVTSWHTRYRKPSGRPWSSTPSQAPPERRGSPPGKGPSWIGRAAVGGDFLSLNRGVGRSCSSSMSPTISSRMSSI